MSYLERLYNSLLVVCEIYDWVSTRAIELDPSDKNFDLMREGYVKHHKYVLSYLLEYKKTLQHDIKNIRDRHAEQSIEKKSDEDIVKEIVDTAYALEEGHFGCNTNGEHEKCEECPLAGTEKCSVANTIWFNEPKKECDSMTKHEKKVPLSAQNACTNHNDYANKGVVDISKEICDMAYKDQHENIDHPSYYGGENSPYEAIKVIEAWGLDFSLGNALKYISRAGKKDKRREIEDLKKAVWYINRSIKNLEEKHE